MSLARVSSFRRRAAPRSARVSVGTGGVAIRPERVSRLKRGVAPRRARVSSFTLDGVAACCVTDRRMTLRSAHHGSAAPSLGGVVQRRGGR